MHVKGWEGRLWKAAEVNDGSQDRHLHCSRIIYDPKDWSKQKPVFLKRSRQAKGEIK